MCDDGFNKDFVKTLVRSFVEALVEELLKYELREEVIETTKTKESLFSEGWSPSKTAFFLVRRPGFVEHSTNYCLEAFRQGTHGDYCRCKCHDDGVP